VTFGQGGVSLCGVPLMCGSNLGRVDLRLCLADAAGRLETTNSDVLLAADEPVARGHGASIVQQRSVADDYGPTLGIAHDNIKVGEWLAPEQLAHHRAVVGLHGSGVGVISGDGGA
jgi:hypothetical protein